MSIPDHWCYVPGRENTNFTLQEWKNITLPIDRDNGDREIFSSCLMYNISNFPDGRNDSGVIGCQHGYEYDKTWFVQTAPSQQDWVCDRELYVTNAFASSKIGEVLGTFMFGQLGDAIGRKPVFYISIVTIITGRVLSALTSSWYSFFLLAAALGNLSITPIFQCPLVISMEISHGDDRAHIAVIQCIAWTIGMCVMPLIMWAVGDWSTFMLITTLPCGLVLFGYKYIIESPRWLASRGKQERALKELTKIAKINGTCISDEVLTFLEKNTSQKPEKVYGMMSLFSSVRLAKNTILMTGCWISSVVCLYTLILNISNMSGNPFLNFLWQSMVEIPAYLLGRYACDRIGRRWTGLGFFCLASITATTQFALLNVQESTWSVLALATFMRFCISITFYVVNLQAMEIYPTCLRQTGISTSVIVSNAMGVLGPFIILLGTQYHISYPYLVMSLVSLMGVLCELFLPETLYKRLPETLAEAHLFGTNHKMWCMPQRKIVNMIPENNDKIGIM
ncbi:carcinine transporter-like [Ctenocephalides felis]|uniref:carcinine transporter-like n=1 Tax=Ctenocephalides felis TaxID=7515 RepID=UPI000E6E184B|nr:carcinine transporter-like [Ctenocephalides felis]